jgi:hypothetical protein
LNEKLLIVNGKMILKFEELDPILHDPTWSNMPTKFPSDIPKFEGKPKEDPTNHIMSFHLWCSSNSIMEDYVLL